MSHLRRHHRPTDADTVVLGDRSMATSCIWIVDDDPSVGRALRRVVQSLDVDCVLCSSGEELLSRIGTARPTFVLLDFHMPNTSGVDALRKMRARGIEVPTVMMTGVEREGNRMTCLAAGATDLLAKPVSIQTIATLLDRFAGHAPDGAPA